MMLRITYPTAIVIDRDVASVRAEDASGLMEPRDVGSVLVAAHETEADAARSHDGENGSAAPWVVRNCA